MYTILRLKKVIEKTGLARSTIYKKIALGEFPPQISLGGKAVGWLKSDVDRWIEKQILKSANDNIRAFPSRFIVQTGDIFPIKPANDNIALQYSLSMVPNTDNN